VRTARDKVHSTGGFWLVMGALLLAAPLRLVCCFWAACVIHELGHLAAVWALGGRVEQIRLTGVGVVILPRRQRLFSYGEECLLALAGPGASLLLAAVAGAGDSEGAACLAGVSLVLGLFNLLPARPLDGGRILQAAVSRWAGPDAGERAGRLLTGILAPGLLGAGLWSLLEGGFAGLFLGGACLLAGEFWGKRGAPAGKP